MNAKENTTQVLVIGSGAGGTTTALTLAEAGFDVLVLEEGKRSNLSEYGQNAIDGMNLLYRNRGMTPILLPRSNRLCGRPLSWR